jgi:peptidoglycan/LPS O-acetylase OafA/YrhL
MINKIKNRSLKYIPQLDTLRGIAIIMVLFHNIADTGHKEIEGNFAKIVSFIADSGWVGVQLFFVLSGFLITGILLDGKGTNKQLFNFYTRRILRIFPLYFIVLSILFILLPILGYLPEWLHTARIHQIWYWTYLVNWASPFFDKTTLGHFWTLAVEEQFYLFWPLVILLMGRRKLCLFCLFLIVSAILARYLLISIDLIHGKKMVYSFTVVRWDSLAIGALAAIAIRNKSYSDFIHVNHKVLILFCIGLIVLPVVKYHSFSPTNGGWTILNQTTSALLFGIIIFVSSSISGGVKTKRILNNSMLKMIGKYSYAIYIFHVPIGYIWSNATGINPKNINLNGFHLIDAMLLNSITVFIISFLFALCSWYFIELPFLRLKNKFI